MNDLGGHNRAGMIARRLAIVAGTATMAAGLGATSADALVISREIRNGKLVVSLISPDGSTRELPPIADPEGERWYGANSMGISADRKNLATFSSKKLWVLPLDGTTPYQLGVPTSITSRLKNGYALGIQWSSDGSKVLLGVRNDAGKDRVVRCIVQSRNCTVDAEGQLPHVDHLGREMRWHRSKLGAPYELLDTLTQAAARSNWARIQRLINFDVRMTIDANSNGKHRVWEQETNYARGLGVGIVFASAPTQTAAIAEYGYRAKIVRKRGKRRVVMTRSTGPLLVTDAAGDFTGVKLPPSVENRGDSRIEHAKTDQWILSGGRNAVPAVVTSDGRQLPFSLKGNRSPYDVADPEKRLKRPTANQLLDSKTYDLTRYARSLSNGSGTSARCPKKAPARALLPYYYFGFDPDSQAAIIAVGSVKGAQCYKTYKSQLVGVPLDQSKPAYVLATKPTLANPGGLLVE